MHSDSGQYACEPRSRIAVSKEQRVALVTGASRGIGRAAAVALASCGTHVLCLARTRNALEELENEITVTGGRCSLIVADLLDANEVSRLPDTLAERFGTLDALVLNAGTLGELVSVTATDATVLSDALTLNVTANWSLLSGLDRLLSASSAARVVGITSSRAHKSVPNWFVYAASKAAFEQLVLTYAAEKESSQIKANLLDPGPVATDMRASAIPGEDQSSLTQPAEIGALIAEMADGAWESTGRLIRFSKER